MRSHHTLARENQLGSYLNEGYQTPNQLIVGSDSGSRQIGQVLFDWCINNATQLAEESSFCPRLASILASMCDVCDVTSDADCRQARQRVHFAHLNDVAKGGWVRQGRWDFERDALDSSKSTNLNIFFMCYVTLGELEAFARQHPLLKYSQYSVGILYKWAQRAKFWPSHFIPIFALRQVHTSNGAPLWSGQRVAGLRCCPQT